MINSINIAIMAVVSTIGVELAMDNLDRHFNNNLIKCDKGYDMVVFIGTDGSSRVQCQPRNIDPKGRT